MLKKIKEEIIKLREEITIAKRPLFLFDADPDGLSSFVLLYKMNKEGMGRFIKSSKRSTELMLNKVKAYSPDCIIILDIPYINAHFFDDVPKTTKIIWIDHHPIQNIKQANVHYFNPRLFNDADNRPTTYWAHKIANNPEDSWLALTGCVSDWQIPDFKKDVLKMFPDLMKITTTKAPEVLFSDSKIGKLYRILSLAFKNPTNKINIFVKIMTRINHYDEIIEQTTSQGKYIYKLFKNINEEYGRVLTLAKNQITKCKFQAVKIPQSKFSFSSELSNELIFNHPDKFIIVCTESEEHYRCSLRSEKYKVIDILNTVTSKISSAGGGGHDHACGARVEKQEFIQFINLLKEEFKKQFPN